jgi:hypothetical protein
MNDQLYASAAFIIEKWNPWNALYRRLGELQGYSERYGDYGNPNTMSRNRTFAIRFHILLQNESDCIHVVRVSKGAGIVQSVQWLQESEEDSRQGQDIFLFSAVLRPVQPSV